MDIRNRTKEVPLGLRWHINRSLSWINAADLAGLEFIEIEHKLPDADSNSPDWHKTASEQDWSVNGLYFRRQSSSPAHVKLFVRDLYRGLPRLYWLTPVVTLRIAHTLAHEVGHHLIAERGYVFAPGEKVTPSEYEEEIAHRYSQFVVKKMKRRWYYRWGDRAIKHLAVWRSGQAYADWKMGDYERAAENWYKSFHLDPDRNEEIHWYKRAKEAAANRQANS